MLKVYFTDVRKFGNEKVLREALDSASFFRREKYESFKFESSKRQSIAATYLLNHYLKSIGLSESNMEYEINKYGKPSFKNHEDIHFCLSHSDNLAMAVFSDSDIGCDIEKVQKIDEKLIDMVLSSEEKKELMAENGEKERYDKFFKYWVMKEAIVKMKGIGLGNETWEIHDNKAYVDEIKLPDIDEKYYFSVYDGKTKITNIHINIV